MLGVMARTRLRILRNILVDDHDEWAPLSSSPREALMREGFDVDAPTSAAPPSATPPPTVANLAREPKPFIALIRSLRWSNDSAAPGR